MSASLEPPLCRGFTRAFSQTDGSEHVDTDVLIMEQTGRAMTGLAIFNMEAAMPSRPVLLRGWSFDNLILHSSGWMG